MGLDWNRSLPILPDIVASATEVRVIRVAPPQQTFRLDHHQLQHHHRDDHPRQTQLDDHHHQLEPDLADIHHKRAVLDATDAEERGKERVMNYIQHLEAFTNLEDPLAEPSWEQSDFDIRDRARGRRWRRRDSTSSYSLSSSLTRG